MTESDKGMALERRLSRETSKTQRAPKISLVDSIKESIRKISGCKEVKIDKRDLEGGGRGEGGGGGGGGRRGGGEKRREDRNEREQRARKLGIVFASHSPRPQRGERRQGGQILGAKRKAGARHGQQDERKSSFELYLDTIPRLDPVDRTVGWVFQQREEAQEDCQDFYEGLPPRGYVMPNPLPSPGLISSSHLKSHDLETSVSRCESERGTHGRGTPPQREAGQPRLDELFRQLQLQQEYEARRQLACMGENYLMSINPLDVNSWQVPGYPAGITPELLPYISFGSKRGPAALVHKNSSLYNQGQLPGDGQQQVCAFDYQCEWGSCRQRYGTPKNLLSHIEEEHLARLPYRLSGQGRTQHEFICQWTSCSKVFSARYKLLLHVQTVHCKEKLQRSNPHNTMVNTETKPSPPPTRHPLSSDTPHKTIGKRAVPRRRQQSSDRITMTTGRVSLLPPTDTSAPVVELHIEPQPVTTRKRTRRYIYPPHRQRQTTREINH